MEEILVEAASSASHKGKARWMLKLPANGLMRLAERETLSYASVSRRLMEDEIDVFSAKARGAALAVAMATASNATGDRGDAMSGYGARLV